MRPLLDLHIEAAAMVQTETGATLLQEAVTSSASLSLGLKSSQGGERRGTKGHGASFATRPSARPRPIHRGNACPYLTSELVIKSRAPYS